MVDPVFVFLLIFCISMAVAVFAGYVYNAWAMNREKLREFDTLKSDFEEVSSEITFLRERLKCTTNMLSKSTHKSGVLTGENAELSRNVDALLKLCSSLRKENDDMGKRIEQVEEAYVKAHKIDIRPTQKVVKSDLTLEEWLSVLECIDCANKGTEGIEMSRALVALHDKILKFGEELYSYERGGKPEGDNPESGASPKDS